VPKSVYRAILPSTVGSCCYRSIIIRPSCRLLSVFRTTGRRRRREVGLFVERARSADAGGPRAVADEIHPKENLKAEGEVGLRGPSRNGRRSLRKKPITQFRVPSSPQNDACSCDRRSLCRTPARTAGRRDHSVCALRRIEGRDCDPVCVLRGVLSVLQVPLGNHGTRSGSMARRTPARASRALRRVQRHDDRCRLSGGRPRVSALRDRLQSRLCEASRPLLCIRLTGRTDR
jgi:hypothetical protein